MKIAIISLTAIIIACMFTKRIERYESINIKDKHSQYLEDIETLKKEHETLAKQTEDIKKQIEETKAKIESKSNEGKLLESVYTSKTIEAKNNTLANVNEKSSDCNREKINRMTDNNKMTIETSDVTIKSGEMKGASVELKEIIIDKRKEYENALKSMESNAPLIAKNNELKEKIAKFTTFKPCAIGMN